MILSFQRGESVSTWLLHRIIVKFNEWIFELIIRNQSLSYLSWITIFFIYRICIQFTCVSVCLTQFGCGPMLHVERGYRTGRNGSNAQFDTFERSSQFWGEEWRFRWEEINLVLAISNCSYSRESNVAFKHANFGISVNRVQRVQNWSDGVKGIVIFNLDFTFCIRFVQISFFSILKLLLN